jgi:hypothetical protein
VNSGRTDVNVCPENESTARGNGEFVEYGEDFRGKTIVNRLLILSCSQRKAPWEGDLPALDRYDGPAFRVLRKYLRTHSDDSLAILILSAKFGLIEAEA